MSKKPLVKPDGHYPAMWRIHWPDGEVSDLINLTRANDAVRVWLETQGRQKRREAALMRFAGDPVSDRARSEKRTSGRAASLRRGG